MATLTARLEARISPDLHAMLKRAAELQGRTLSDFIVSTVQEAAHKTIQQAEVLRLSVADQERFAQALLNPPKPNAALKRAFKRRTKPIASEGNRPGFVLPRWAGSLIVRVFTADQHRLTRIFTGRLRRTHAGV